MILLPFSLFFYHNKRISIHNSKLYIENDMIGWFFSAEISDIGRHRHNIANRKLAKNLEKNRQNCKYFEKILRVSGMRALAGKSTKISAIYRQYFEKISCVI